MAHDPKTLQEAITYFAKSENCIEYLAERRWPDGKAKCPTCGREDVAYMPARRVWQCKSRHPKSQFSIKVGTIFEDSPIGLDKWLASLWMLANCKNGASSWEIHRTIGVTQKTAWFMLHRIRLALRDDKTNKFGPDGGPVEVDEAYVGGQPKNKHLGKRDHQIGKKNLLNLDGSIAGPNPDYKPHSITGRATRKTPVFGMLDREARQVRAQVIPEVKREALMNAILANT